MRDVSPKVTGATIGAALTTLVLYAIETIWHVDLPASVEGAILTLLVALVTFVAGYLPEDPKRR
ncbi:hypothetical protein [Rubrobacter calidifluminis]|uniref:hypothetical protein n=1 Tax=Rubrobacter calidifluminis TaxID=1392640 RepID=UPI0023622BB4|nr:hypothetical protein [Rubrobacter calidifluminis]